MFGAITSLVRNSLPPRCTYALPLSFRSYPRRYFTPPPAQSLWSPKLDEALKETQTAEDIWKAKSNEALQRLKERPPANTYAGRSVNVKGANFADAYARLQSILQRNKVQVQLRRAERHEKKGVKRRRLSSERWRKQFAHEVRRKVQLVEKIRRRGA